MEKLRVRRNEPEVAILQKIHLAGRQEVPPTQKGLRSCTPSSTYISACLFLQFITPGRVTLFDRPLQVNVCRVLGYTISQTVYPVTILSDSVWLGNSLVGSGQQHRFLRVSGKGYPSLPWGVPTWAYHRTNGSGKTAILPLDVVSERYGKIILSFD